MQHPTFGINSLNLSVSLIHILVFHLLTTLHMSDTHSPPPLSTSITPSLFHSRLKTHFFLKSSTIDSSTDTHWTDLTDSIPTGPFSLACRIWFSFFSSRLSAVDWAYFCRLLSYIMFFHSFIHSFIHSLFTAYCWSSHKSNYITFYPNVAAAIALQSSTTIIITLPVVCL